MQSKDNFTTKHWMDNKIKSHTPEYLIENFSNLDEWRKVAKEKIKELLGEDFKDNKYSLVIENTEQNEKYKKIRFIVETNEDKIPCNLIIPSNASKKLPLILCIQGHMTGMHLSMGEIKYSDDEKLLADGMDFAIQAINNGYASLTVELKGMGEKRFNLDIEGSVISCYRPTTAAILFGKTMIGMRVAEIMSVLNSLKEFKNESIDLDKIYCLGHSGGGTTALFLSCLEEKITGVIISCALCEFEYSILYTEHCLCNYIPSLFKYFNMGDIACLLYPKPTIVVAGKNDDIFLIEGIKKSFEKMVKFYKNKNCQSKIELIIGDGKHQFFPNLVWPIIKNIMG